RRVANDREQPRSPVADRGSAETPEIPQRAQGGVLHDVLGIVVVPREVARQRVRGVQMRQHDGFESLELARLQPVLGVRGPPAGYRPRTRQEYSRRNKGVTHTVR